MTPLVGHDKLVCNFVADLLETSFGDAAGVGFLDGTGTLVAGVVYHNHDPEAAVVEMSAASLHRRWGTREALRFIYKVPFEYLDCQMVVGRTDEDNPIPMHIWRALGADEFFIPRLRGRGKGQFISTLTVEQWRASKFCENHGQKVCTEAA
jgi:RimJ/RimL family protein N-acetyltransferase